MLTHQDKEKIRMALDMTKGVDPLNQSFTSEDCMVIYGLACTLYQKGDIEEAKPIFKRLVSLKSFEPQYWEGLALCWQKEEEYQEAIKAWTAASLLENDSPLPHFHLLECYLAIGDGAEGNQSYAACQKRLSEKDTILREKLETLSISLSELAQKEA